jgi:hypothetical protein
MHPLYNFAGLEIAFLVAHNNLVALALPVVALLAVVGIALLRSLTRTGLKTNGDAVTLSDMPGLDGQPPAFLPLWLKRHLGEVVLRVVGRDKTMPLGVPGRIPAFNNTQHGIFKVVGVHVRPLPAVLPMIVMVWPCIPIWWMTSSMSYD